VCYVPAMALTACPECQGKVSSAAASCPHCGHPLGKSAPGMAQPLISPRNPPAAVGAETVLWEGSPSLRVLAVDGIRAAIFTIVVIVGTVLLYAPILKAIASVSDGSAEVVVQYTPGFRLAAILFVVVLVGLRLARLAWRAVALRHHHYRVTNQRLTWESGVLSKSLVEIDFRTVEDVGLHQSLTERLLKVGQIEIVTSDVAGALGAPGMPAALIGSVGVGGRRTRVSLVGIAEPRDVRETIRGAAYQATHGQLFTRST